jgi:hypothetical protein
VRADAPTTSFPPLAIHTKYLKTFRVLVLPQPVVESALSYLSAMLRSVIVYMVNTEKCLFFFATAYTTITTICLKNLISENTMVLGR